MADLTSAQLKQLARSAYQRGDVEKARLRLRQAKEAELKEANARGGVGEFGYSTGAGAARGAAATVDAIGPLAGGFVDIVNRGGQKVAEILGLVPEGTSTMAPKAPAPTVRDKVAELTGGYSEYESPLKIGQYGGTIGEFGGGAAILPIGGPLRSVGSSVLPAIASETAGQATAGTEYEDMARIAAAVSVPAAQAALTPTMRRIASGPSADVKANITGSTRPQSVETLERAGVTDVSAGQKIGSEALMRLEDNLGPSTTAQTQLTQAVAREAGIVSDAGVISQSAIQSNLARLRDGFNRADDLAGGIPTQVEGMNAVNLVSAAEEMMSEGVKVPKVLVNVANEIGNAFVDGKVLNAATIKQMRAKLNKALKTYAPAMDKQIERELAEDLLETLDDMVKRQISETSPEFLDEFAKIRQQYRAHLTMERALTGGGAAKAAGIITPESLASATARREGVSYTRGTGSDLAELARASQEVLTPLPRVAEGGVRYGPSGNLGMVTGLIPRTAAGMMQETLPMPARQAISQRLLERLARQTGGLLNVD